MSDYVRFLGEHRRITVLRILDGAPGYCANDSLLTSACATYGLHATRDQVRGDIAWLAEQGLVRAADVGGGLTVATLTERGRDVAGGRATHPGVQRPSPD